MSDSATETILAGDVGGTNTRFQLYEVSRNAPSMLKQNENAPGKLIFSKKYMNEEYPTFNSVLQSFLEESSVPKPPVTMCLAVAGPVADNKVKFTNRESWSIDGEIMSHLFGIQIVRLVNDFVANGYGLLCLDESAECEVIQAGPKMPDAPIACIGAGTGLGECFLTPYGNNHYQCFPSEGGHAEFAPRSELEFDLLRFLKKKFKQQNRVSVERVISGTGLVNVYEFLCEKYPNKVNPEVHAKIELAGDMKGAIIATSQAVCGLCAHTMQIFAEAYGAEAGVAGLKWLPYGGLYLTGGLTPKNMNLLLGENSHFMKAFRDKGRVSGMLYKIPVFAVKSDNLGERGAHRVAYQDFLFEVVFPQEQHIAGSATGSQKSPERASGKTGGESSLSCCFRRIGYLAAGYFAVRLVAGMVGGWDSGSSVKASV